MTHLLLFLHGTSCLRTQIGSCTLLQFSTVMVSLSSVSYWYMLYLCLFRLSFSRFCGNKLACPLCVGFFKQTCRQKQVTAQKLLLVNTQQTAYLLMRTHRWCERPIQQVRPTQNLWTFLTNWLFFTVFVSWGGFDYIISQFVPYEIFERKLDEHLDARKPW